VYGPFFFMETTITGIVYLDMLQEFLIPQLDEDDQEGRIHFQQAFKVVKLFLKHPVYTYRV